MLQTAALFLVQGLLRYAVDASLRRALPTIYRRLDIDLPWWFSRDRHPSTAQVERIIRNVAADALGVEPTSEQLQLIRLLYDPVQIPKNSVAIRVRHY